MTQTDVSGIAEAPSRLPEAIPQPSPAGSTSSPAGAGRGATVAICTPTCKRPRNLTDLLLSVQELDQQGLKLHIIIVDNDANQSARGVVREVMKDSSIPVTYDCVEQRSLPLVRNRLVELAIGLKADWIWFLDDDQFVEPDSLQLMLRTATDQDADCVIARVPHTFENSESQWARWSGIFDEVQRPTGKVVRSFGTNGALLRCEAVAQIPEPFDPRLRLTGGSDGLFFARFRAHGFTSVGCNEAVLYDRVHVARNNPRWLTQRALRIGLVKGFIVREVEPSLLRSAKWVFLGGSYALSNLLLTMLTFPLGPARYFRYWIKAVRGYGIAKGTMFPKHFLDVREYATIHGE